MAVRADDGTFSLASVFVASADLRAANGTRTDDRSAGSLRSRFSPAPPGGQIHSACPWLRWPSRSAPPALDLWPASLAARSPCCLHHRQQSPHMFRIKSPPDHQAPAVLQPDFDPRVARYVGRGLRHLHFHESRRSVFPQPFLPPVEMRRAQRLLSAERRHTLPAPHLFGNQPAPPRPCFSASFSLRHRTTLLCDDPSPQDAVHIALTFGRKSRIEASRDRGTTARLRHPTPEIRNARSPESVNRDSWSNGRR